METYERKEHESRDSYVGGPIILVGREDVVDLGWGELYLLSLFFLLIVSPELSSGRDLAIQMSVRRPYIFCPEHFSETVWPTLMIFGMWVGLGPKVRMLNFGRGIWGPLGPLGSKMLNNEL